MLPYFHAETDTAVRDDFIALVRTVVQRLRGAVLQLGRVVQRHYIEKQAATIRTTEVDSKQRNSKFDLPSEYMMDQHMAFQSWYIRFLVSELQPTASYQRHITTLKILTIILHSGLDDAVPQGHLPNAQGYVNWPANIPVVQSLLLRQLFDLSMDSFDDVREAAVLLIKMCRPVGLGDRHYSPGRRPFPESKELSASYCSRSGQAAEGSFQGPQDGLSDLMIVLARAQKTLHGTGRADHADGVARLYEILHAACSGRPSKTPSEAQSGNDRWSSTFGIIDRILTALEDGLLLAKSNLRLAVASAPIHGYLAALRYHNLALIVLC